MKMISKTLLGAATAAFLTTAVATPADAQRYRRYDRDNGISLEDIVVGVIAVAGVATAVAAIGDIADGNNRYTRGRSDERASVDACRNAAEREAGRRYGERARVRDIDDVDRRGRGDFRVRGTLEVRDREYSRGGYDRYDTDRVQFSCEARYGRVTDLRIGGDYAYRY